jgi:hypothetical protein
LPRLSLLPTQLVEIFRTSPEIRRLATDPFLPAAFRAKVRGAVALPTLLLRLLALCSAAQCHASPRLGCSAPAVNACTMTHEHTRLFSMSMRLLWMLQVIKDMFTGVKEASDITKRLLGETLLV